MVALLFAFDHQHRRSGSASEKGPRVISQRRQSHTFATPGGSNPNLYDIMITYDKNVMLIAK
jgi:hypothetical protein